MSVDQGAGGGNFDMGRVVSATFAAVQKNATLLFPASLVFVALTQTISYFGLVGLEPSNMITSPLYWFALVFALLGGFIFQAFVIHVVVESQSGAQPSIGRSFAASLRSLLPLIATGILVVLGCYLGMILLIVPGIILFVMWSVAVPVVVVEGVGPIQALGRSRALTKGSRWAIFGLSLVAIILFMIISLAIYGFNFAAMSTAMQSPDITRVIATGLVSCVTTVLMYAGIAAIYSELRMIKEGVANSQLAAAFE
jgi:hypothetical protein